jgi:predicted HD phosphohydrolase
MAIEKDRTKEPEVWMLRIVGDLANHAFDKHVGNKRRDRAARQVYGEDLCDALVSEPKPEKVSFEPNVELPGMDRLRELLGNGGVKSEKDVAPPY